jgi:hypothetical protein
MNATYCHLLPLVNFLSPLIGQRQGVEKRDMTGRFGIRRTLHVFGSRSSARDVA